MGFRMRLRRGYYLIFVLAAFVFYLFIHCNNSSSPTHSRKVFIQKEGKRYTIYRNGKPFVVKGASGYTHLTRLRETGGNTIRTWDTVNIAAILDEAYRNNLAVIVGLPLPGSNYLDYFYKDTAKVAATCSAFKKIVAQYKSHPALLMWCLGNEPGFSYKPGRRPFYKAFNGLLDMIHTTDPDHPVTTTMVNFSIWQALLIKWRVHGLDVISFNTFGELHLLKDKLDKYAWLWNGPFLVTEWGTYGPWEVDKTAWGAPIENTSTKKAEQYQRLYTQLPFKNPGFLGALVFYWGQKEERTPTWFSLFDENGAATEIVGVMQYLWTGRQPSGKTPQVSYMLVNNKGASDNIMFKPNTPQVAEILMQDTIQDPLAFHWEIWQEDWFGELRIQPRKILDTLITSAGNSKLQFKSPSKEGPYRIYVKVFDNHRNVATANTPFYVIEQE